MNNTFSEKLETFKHLIDKTNHIAVLSGAGVSTLSGIPDFRSQNGLYNNVDPEFNNFQPEYLLSHDCLYHNPKFFYKFYRTKMNCNGFKPNIVHIKMAEWEKNGKRVSIATQNIDGLHEQAGNKEVYTIHGSTYRNYCTKCKKSFPSNYIFTNTDEIPKCPDCKGVGFVRPDVTLYGEQLPNDFVNASEAFHSAELLIIAGTSLTVSPANYLPSDFWGDNIVIINKEPTSFENYATLVFTDLKEVFENL